MVHDYIEVEDDIAELIINNIYFQRLRRIEQTSMRCVYPSARHDRFIHSLGTYHLACNVVSAIKSNRDILKQKSEKEFSEAAFLFELAALLHDVGHSPMSHTLEHKFKTVKSQIDDIEYDLPSYLDQLLKNELPNLKNFTASNAMASDHEIMSAIITIKCFKESLAELCNKRRFKLNLEFIARCIMGYLYTEHDNSDTLHYIYNSLIKLLNSQAIDVDKLDYITRDSIISGYNNRSIDSKRLLNSLSSYQQTKSSTNDNAFILVFGKSALSVVQNVVNSRNMLYKWVYAHHKVSYESEYLLPTAFEKSVIAEAEERNISENNVLRNLFSVDAIVNNLVCDDDIWVLIKKHRNCCDEAMQLFDRQKHRIALWKSSNEFDLLFSESSKNAFGEFSLKHLMELINSKSASSKIEEFIKYIFKKFGSKDMNAAYINIVKFIPVETKMNYIIENDVLIKLNGKVYSFDKLDNDQNKTEKKRFFYAYIDEKLLNEKMRNLLHKNKTSFIKEFVDYIKAYDGFKLPYNS
jgi:HD superfamily phosphohydrolase